MTPSTVQHPRAGCALPFSGYFALVAKARRRGEIGIPRSGWAGRLLSVVLSQAWGLAPARHHEVA